MPDVFSQITDCFAQAFPTIKLLNITMLPQAGSDRLYYRLNTELNTYIATYGNNIKENETFLYFTQHFTQKKLPVPKVVAVNADCTIYIQEDLGNTSLLQVLETEGYTTHVYDLFKQSLQKLVQLQYFGHKQLDYKKCLTNKEFGKQAIMADLLYFKYYFLDTLQQPYDKQALIDDFEALSSYLTHSEYKYFMFRDFQSRNIMVKDNEVFFIDYQGGMRGAPQYDAASLLWQAKANLSNEWKEFLLNDYMDAFEITTKKKIDRGVFKSQFNGYVLIRLLQVLGAYGFRGLFERKAHFLSSIPQALQNLQWFINNTSIGIGAPALKKALQLITSPVIIERFKPMQATEETQLKVIVQSFSYKKGLPNDASGNGGGFIFDCRGILNPGRFEEYKKLSGQDKSVMDFLEQKTKMPTYLNSVFDLIDINVEDYLARGFDSLQINFGCTGGQHRSVFAAEQTARHLRNKYKLPVQAVHTNKDNWVK
jgi:aminoglycoside/choline kinase family phosphotransferase